MSMILDKDFNKSTMLDDFWQKIRNNTETLEEFCNTTREIADTATTPAEVDQKLAELVDSIPGYIQALHDFEEALKRQGGDVIALLNQLIEDYVKNGSYSNEMAWTEEHKTKVVGVKKNASPSGNDGFCIYFYDGDFDTMHHSLFIDGTTGRIYINNTAGKGNWIDCGNQLDTLQMMLAEGRIQGTPGESLIGTVENNENWKAGHTSAIPYVHWDFNTSVDYVSHIKTTVEPNGFIKFNYNTWYDSRGGVKTDAFLMLEVYETNPYSKDTRTLYKTKIPFSEWVELTATEYKVILPSFKVVAHEPMVTVKITPDSKLNNDYYPCANTFMLNDSQAITAKPFVLEG